MIGRFTKFARKMKAQAQDLIPGLLRERGTITNSGSKSGMCKACQANERTIRPKVPPLHPHCKCHLRTNLARKMGTVHE